MSFPPDLHHVRDPGRNGTGPTGPRKRDPDLVSEIQRRLERASRMQQELAELREELLVQREKFRSSGNELRTQRIATGDAEVAFMNALRQSTTPLRLNLTS
ncbi:hypothetical protein BU26DRAFT_516648 [Trematosphaeria pertusa]|uniref:Uncharacterized protein n=1 Tax=Trematosphaeria pertusa TaxID=390896 RepID=A0A6A6IN86_9PLEO|nr:uncharacterized protein BU26DRAFT_516648 [Trematosphaeria pertusa]KAF2251921.1 hypothetical protein BU26DRAFT_516648 [Trematosphaeria pertusa]